MSFSSRASTNGLLFASDRDGPNGTYEIYSANADGSGVTRLTNNVENDNRPEWAPDGSKIIFVHEQSAGDSRIEEMDPEGTNVRDLSSVSQNCPTEFSPCDHWLDSDPSWSPDGARIAFTRAYRTSNVYIMNADGTQQRQVTTGPSGDSSPDWSPNGQRIVFSSHMNNSALDLFTVNSDGSDVVQLTHTAAYERDPAWSPQGSWIAFASDVDSPVADVYDIYLIATDGSEVRRLTTSVADDINPAWSPDGRQIIFSSDRDGNYELYSIGVDGADLKRLTTNISQDIDPAWEGDLEPSQSSSATQTASDSSQVSPSTTSSTCGECTLSTSITIAYSGEADDFGGSVRSPARRCVKRRYVVLKKARHGSDVILGNDRTGRAGRWSVGRFPHPRGRYYAFVRARTYTDSTGEEIHCASDYSPTLRKNG
ncbi:MAG: hypothetical protein QOC87_762 [Actinomycetota bacterium]|nr:hypothetical protein [Actinomycetota bacterium]